MASNKKSRGASKRPYRMKTRARKLEETRRRITEALVELHGTVGPARTTVSEVAQRAGVRRMTVYNHFASDLEMFDACSAHWVAAHPPPDPAEWERIEDPDARMRRGLEELYRFYRNNRGMVGNFVRDAALLPALALVLRQKWDPLMEALAGALVGPAAGREASDLRVAVRLAISFETWHTLTGAGLGDEEAARLASRMVAAARDRSGPRTR